MMLNKSKPTIFWDFDGTLVAMPGLWRMALIDVLNENEPGHAVDPEQIRPFLMTGFPWHEPEKTHLHLTSDDYWLNLEPIFIRAYQGVGLEESRAKELAKHVRKHIIDPRRYVVYNDTLPVLKSLKEKGWQHFILSNHVPELPDIVEAIGLSSYIDLCISSANSGYVKPRPEIFRNALNLAGNPEQVWMVGDNLIADVQGAESVGIPGILVRVPNEGHAKYYAQNLHEAELIITSNS